MSKVIFQSNINPRTTQNSMYELSVTFTVMSPSGSWRLIGSITENPGTELKSMDSCGAQNETRGLPLL
jgi:hypothetical protein